MTRERQVVTPASVGLLEDVLPELLGRRRHDPRGRVLALVKKYGRNVDFIAGKLGYSPEAVERLLRSKDAPRT